MAHVELNKVASVYSGQDGSCCCGCSGKHTYASQYRDWSSKDRGYEVKENEVSDRSVKTLVNKMNKLFEDGVEKEDGDDPSNLVSVVNGNRLYIAYLNH